MINKFYIKFKTFIYILSLIIIYNINAENKNENVKSKIDNSNNLNTKTETIEPFDFFEKRFTLIPKNEQSQILNQAIDFYFKKKFDKSKIYFEKYFAEKKENSYARSIYALTLAQLNDLNNALTQISIALELESNNVDYIIIQVEILKNLGRLNEALNFLEDYKYKFEHDPNIHYYLAELYLLNKQIEEAQIHFLQTLFYLDKAGSRIVYYQKVTLWRLVQILFAKREFKKAQNFLVEYLELNPNNSFARFMLADYVYFQNGKFEEAKKELEILLAADPQSFMVSSEQQYVEIFKQIENLLLQVYTFTREPSLQTYITFLENLSPIQEILIKSNGNLNEKESLELLQNIKTIPKYNVNSYIVSTSVKRILERLASKNKKYIQDYINQLLLCSQFALNFKRIGESLDYLNTALNLYNNNTDVVSVLTYKQILLLKSSVFQSYHQNRRAALYLIKLIDFIKKTDEVNENLILTELAYIELISKNNPKFALSKLNKILSKNLNNNITSKVYSSRARIFLSEQNWQNAINDFDKSLKLEQNMENLYLKAYSKIQIKDYDSSLEDLQKVKENKIYNLISKNLMAYTLALANKNLDDALPLQLSVIENDASNPTFQDTLAWIYFKKNEFIKAKYHLELAINLFKQNSKYNISKKELVIKELDHSIIDSFDHLGDTYIALHRNDLALNTFKEAVSVINIFNKESLKKGIVNSNLVMLKKTIESKIYKLLKKS